MICEHIAAVVVLVGVKVGVIEPVEAVIVDVVVADAADAIFVVVVVVVAAATKAADVAAELLGIVAADDDATMELLQFAKCMVFVAVHVG